MPPEVVFWTVYVILAGGGGSLAALISERRKLANKIGRVPRRSIAQVADNTRACISGTVRRYQDIVEAGLTAPACRRFSGLAAVDDEAALTVDGIR